MSSVITTSVITGGSNSHATTSADVNALGTDFLTAGCVGTLSNTNGVAPNTGSFAVNAQGTPAMFVDLKAGQAWITATPTGQASQKLRANMTADYTSYAISANASGSTKFDWIYLSVDPTNASTPNSAADNVTSLVTSRSSSNSTDNGTPPTYGILLAKVTVANGATSITNANIADARTQATITAAASSNGWTTGLATPNTVTANGNRSYSLVFNGTDLTSTLSPGMRLRTSRLVTAPTQCTSLNGTTQFYSKTSPSGMTFTNNFVLSAWIKPTAYGAIGMIQSRSDVSTGGWDFYMATTGQIIATGYNASTANGFAVTSYQSVPLNKWTHVTLQMDMTSTTTTGNTANYIMFDGIEVPSFATRTGTNPTSLNQVGTYNVGARNSVLFFPGKIAQVAIYNAKVTQATILASIHQGLAGTETSLISAYSFNNSISDLNANANNLTANGSAVATATDSPFTINSFGTATGTTDYAIITSCTFSTNTTVVVQVPEANTIPTSGGVSAVAYSLQKVPYGFPAQRGKWRIIAVNKILTTSVTPTDNTYANVGNLYLSVPIGEWILGPDVIWHADKSATTVLKLYGSLSTTTNSDTDNEFTQYAEIDAGSATLAVTLPSTRAKEVSLSSQTIYYAIAKCQTSAGNLYQRGDVAASKIIAECAHL